VPRSSQLAAREPIHLRTHDLREALSDLFVRGVTTVLVEGGPTIATQLLRDGLVDRLIWYIAPSVIGGGLPAVGDLGITTIADVERFDITSVTRVGSDVRVDLAPRSTEIQGGGN
jgi:diaminohydroxyphosphoribosylaminopyrimidine deaminase/5-amino-6-(5-phosphoribosylamino)uracil reductase